MAGGVKVPEDCPGVFVEGAEEGGLGGGACLCRGEIRCGWVPSVAGTDTGATDRTVAGEAVMAVAGETEAEAAAALPPPVPETAQPMTNAVTRASVKTAATSIRRGRERGNCATDEPPPKPKSSNAELRPTRISLGCRAPRIIGGRERS